MRIRKRKVPLPLSLLSPIPISDPHLFSRSPVTPVQPAQHEEQPTAPPHDNHVNNGFQPSDHLTSSHLSRLIDDGISSSDRLLLRHDDCLMIGSDPFLTERVPHELVGCLGVEGVEGMPKSNDDSNKSITTLGATTTTTAEVSSNNNNGPSQLPNHDEDRTRRSDEDKLVPLKKRIKFVIDEEKKKINIEDNNGNSDNNNDKTKNNIDNNVCTSAKKGGKRGNTIMEGSRCSRVNGRGWRCCQPTLVGYSLCEHHLGKGRLRSVSSVRGRPSKTSKKAVLGTSLREDCSSLMQLCEAVKQESESDQIRVGKRVKLGVVKARSLSSLLGQNNTTS